MQNNYSLSNYAEHALQVPEIEQELARAEKGQPVDIAKTAEKLHRLSGTLNLAAGAKMTADVQKAFLAQKQAVNNLTSRMNAIAPKSNFSIPSWVKPAAYTALGVIGIAAAAFAASNVLSSPINSGTIPTTRRNDPNIPPADLEIPADVKPPKCMIPNILKQFANPLDQAYVASQMPGKICLPVSRISMKDRFAAEALLPGYDRLMHGTGNESNFNLLVGKYGSDNAAKTAHEIIAAAQNSSSNVDWLSQEVMDPVESVKGTKEDAAVGAAAGFSLGAIASAVGRKSVQVLTRFTTPNATTKAGARALVPAGAKNVLIMDRKPYLSRLVSKKYRASYQIANQVTRLGISSPSKLKFLVTVTLATVGGVTLMWGVLPAAGVVGVGGAAVASLNGLFSGADQPKAK